MSQCHWKWTLCCTSGIGDCVVFCLECNESQHCTFLHVRSLNNKGCMLIHPLSKLYLKKIMASYAQLRNTTTLRNASTVAQYQGTVAQYWYCAQWGIICVNSSIPISATQSPISRAITNTKGDCPIGTQECTSTLLSSYTPSMEGSLYYCVYYRQTHVAISVITGNATWQSLTILNV